MIDYLYQAELTQHVDSVDEMAAKLRARGFERAALRTEQIARVLRRAEELRDAIEPVWRIIDKRIDGKANDDGVREVVAAWEADQPRDLLSELEDAEAQFRASAARLRDALDNAL